MDEIFLKLLNMSITASWLVLVVILLRLFLKKAPKWTRSILWVFIAIRLVCPFSLESILSLIPSAEAIPQNILLSHSPQINSGLSALNQVVNPILASSLAPSGGASVNPLQVITFIASILWIAGMAAMLLYGLISFLRIHNKVRESVLLRENIWLCDRIAAPFILGLFRPRIYLPSSINDGDAAYVLAHEKAHLKRRDHLWKPLGFLLLTVYWFNPILWVAYNLLCKDIELACDEKVIRTLGIENKKPYSDALINCSVPRKMIAACPLAFGEVGVKARVKNVLNYRKPAFWIIIAAIVVCIATAVCFLTNPKKETNVQILNGVIITEVGSDCEDVHWEIKSIDENFTVTMFLTNDTKKGLSFGNEFFVYRVSGEGAGAKLQACPMKKDTGFNYNAILLQNTYSFQRVFPIQDHYEIDKKEKHRLSFHYSLEGDPTEHTLWIDFMLGETAITGTQYEAVSWLYNRDPNEYWLFHTRQQCVISDDMVLTNIMRTAATEPAFHKIGQLKKYSLTKASFDALLNEAPWANEYSAAKIREENDKAYRVSAAEENNAGDVCYHVFYQKNGNVFLAYEMAGHIHWILKMMPLSGTEGTDRGEAPLYMNIGPDHYFEGTILEINEKTILVQPDETWTERKLTEKISVPLESSALVVIPEMHVGDRVGIQYNGAVKGTNPGKISDTVLIENLDEYTGSARISGGEAGPFYCYQGVSEIFRSNFSLYQDNTFQFNWSPLSSYIAIGHYEKTDKELIFTTDDGKYRYIFDIDGDDFLFNEKKSSKIPRYRLKADSDFVPTIPDGARFTLTS